MSSEKENGWMKRRKYLWPASPFGNRQCAARGLLSAGDLLTVAQFL